MRARQHVEVEVYFGTAGIEAFLFRQACRAQRGQAMTVTEGLEIRK